VLGVTALFFCAALAGSFHHHKELGDHSACSVCDVIHHAPAAEAAAPILASLILPVSPALFLPPVPLTPAPWTPSRPRNRAPPA